MALVDVDAAGCLAVRLPAVGDDCRALLDVVDEKLPEGVGAGVRDDLHPAPAEPLRVENFHCHNDQRLLARGAATPVTGRGPAEEGLVDLDGARQQLTAGADEN